MEKIGSFGRWRASRTGVVVGVALTLAIAGNGSSHAQESAGASSKLLLTGGVASVEGSAGGGLTPWAVIAGYGTRDQIGANAFATSVRTGDYALGVVGAQIGFQDRLEVSVAQQKFDTRAVGGTLGLGNGYTFTQKIVGLKLKLVGDAVLEQDSWLPQIALGIQRKDNDRGTLLRALGARSDRGTDIYLAATKLYLAQSILVNGTVRFTKANQMGILGFGTTNNDRYRAQFETSIALLLRRDLAIGVEYRGKPDALGFREDRWLDAFVAYTPSKNISVTLAWVDLGNIVIKDRQKGAYASVQVGF